MQQQASGRQSKQSELQSRLFDQAGFGLTMIMFVIPIFVGILVFVLVMWVPKITKANNDDIMAGGLSSIQALILDFAYHSSSGSYYPAPAPVMAGNADRAIAILLAQNPPSKPAGSPGITLAPYAAVLEITAASDCSVTSLTPLLCRVADKASGTIVDCGFDVRTAVPNLSDSVRHSLGNRCSVHRLYQMVVGYIDNFSLFVFLTPTGSAPRGNENNV